MTDFVEENLDNWAEVECLQRFIAAGLLDFAVLDAEHSSQAITLKHAKVPCHRRHRVCVAVSTHDALLPAACCPLLADHQTVLSPETIVNPVVLICNYVFDSLPQDFLQASVCRGGGGGELTRVGVMDVLACWVATLAHQRQTASYE